MALHSFNHCLFSGYFPSLKSYSELSTIIKIMTICDLHNIGESSYSPTQQSNWKVTVSFDGHPQWSGNHLLCRCDRCHKVETLQATTQNALLLVAATGANSSSSARMTWLSLRMQVDRSGATRKPKEGTQAVLETPRAVSARTCQGNLATASKSTGGMSAPIPPPPDNSFLWNSLFRSKASTECPRAV